MRILLVGCTGLLGKTLLKTAPNHVRIIPTTHRQDVAGIKKIMLDCIDAKQVSNVIQKARPDILINAASLGDVDYCENHQEEAWNVNVLGNKNLLSAAKWVKARFIFFSSNAVFDGKHAPYSEEYETHPVNFYGKTKVQAEQDITKQYASQSIIFRLNTMYGWNDSRERQNPATWIIDRLRKNKRTPVVTDVYNNHLWVGQAASCVWKAIEKEMYGELFHIAGKDCISRHEFCRTVAKVFHLNKELLTKVTSDYFKAITPRALNTCVLTKKMEALLNVKPLSLLEGLGKMKNEED